LLGSIQDFPFYLKVVLVDAPRIDNYPTVWDNLKGSTNENERIVTMAIERPRLFYRLKKGLEEGIAHERGERSLRVTDVVVPDPPQSYGPDDVRRIRTRMRMSQAGFARLLQVSSKTVQSWEQGIRRPQQSSARLLQFIEHPDLLTTLAQYK
jgi:putative transcriptional regulator